MLLLDDIGAENVTAWGRDEVLGPLLQYRMEEHVLKNQSVLHNYYEKKILNYAIIQDSTLKHPQYPFSPFH